MTREPRSVAPFDRWTSIVAVSCVAAAFGAALSPLTAASLNLSVPYEMFRLSNGLTVIVHEDRSAPVATVNTWYHVGSARETPGRTGFAHLFEHIMFEGSKNVPEGAFDRWLEALGGNNNGSTNTDRTNYYEMVPANAVEMALFLESDRMGYLLDTMTPQRVDGQRDVVKNERRQSYENPPYGMWFPLMIEALYPPEHPYSWPTIGSMEDLSAASHEDVANFFKAWYGPRNSSLVVAGDVDAGEMRALTEKWFGELPPGRQPPPLQAQPVVLEAEKRLIHEDRVQLPRLYLAWVTPPYLSPADAALTALPGILADGKNSRLYKRLVYDLQVAQDVSAFTDSGALASTLFVIVTARSGHSLEEIRRLVDEEISRIANEPPSARELERFVNQREAQMFRLLESNAGKADAMNEYFFYTGNPDYFNEDLARFHALAPNDISAAADRWLGSGRVALSIVPEGRRDMALPTDEAASSGSAPR